MRAGKEKYMQEKDRKDQNSLPTKMRLTMWVFVGGYLLYTVWSLKDSFSTHVGGERYLMIGFMALFTLAGMFLLIKGGHGLLTGRYVDGVMDVVSEKDAEKGNAAEENVIEGKTVGSQTENVAKKNDH